jgi:hypothetical protein
MDNVQCQADLINQLVKHSNKDVLYYYNVVKKDELIGKGAIVLFLLKLHDSSIGHGVYNEDKLKTWSDGDHRNTIIAENHHHTGIRVDALQAVINENLVRLALEWSLIAAEEA